MNPYDENSFFTAYSKMSRSVEGLKSAAEWRQLRLLFPALEGKMMLDLGCGYGWHCKYAVQQGAKAVLGIDLSEKMIGEAKKRNADPKITYRVCGIDAYDYPADSYDLVVSNLALHYLADLDEVYRGIFRTLKERGLFLFNIEHPTFTAGVNEDWLRDAEVKTLCWPEDDYFLPGARAVNFLGQKVIKQHHTLTQILGGLLRCGFRIDAVEEAMPSPEMACLPDMKDEMRRPMMLLARAEKIR